MSVIIVCYNQARYLRDAIESALIQTWSDRKVLVVDDGSTDDTEGVARAFSQVCYIRQENRGLSAARNTGIRRSSGRYLVFLDADDRLLAGAIESGLNCFLQNPDSGFVFGAYRNIYDDGSPAPTGAADRVDRDHYWRLLQGNLIGMHATVLYSREVLEAAGGFDETLKACEDYDLYLRIARRWPAGQHTDIVAEYRQHDTNMSRDYAFMLKSVLAVLRTEKRRVPDSRHRRALRSGTRIWRDYYGRLLLDEWKQDRSLRRLLLLLRLHPRGILRQGGRRVLASLRGVLRRRTRFGDLSRLAPFSRRFGLDRGQPIDRYYIESFLASHAHQVRGRVLEVGDDAYSRKFGGSRITNQEVLHVVPGYPGATITGDLADAPHIESNQFDCIILTQTLHYIYNLSAALTTLERILKPGGVLLATLPGISQVCRDQLDLDSDCWRFTASSAQRLFREYFSGGDLHVNTYGNVLTATAFLYGLAAHELSPGELDHRDEDYPVTIAVAVKKGKPA